MKPSAALLHRLVSASLFLVPVAFGILSLSYGQDANWDLRNYHWYNPYAFLGGRLGNDLGAAHIATFYNPVIDLPLYLIGMALPARAVGFVLGAVHGLNYVALFYVVRAALTGMGAIWPSIPIGVTAAVVALVGVTGGGHLGLVGTTFNDNLVSLALLGAALVLGHAPQVWRDDPGSLGRADVAWIMGAGILVGGAVGLKLPTAPFAVGVCAAFLCVGGHFFRRVLCAFLFGLGVLLGFAIAGGPWMAMLWRDYGNPLFPYFNTFFKSPYGIAQNYRDTRFLPDGVGAWLAYPFLFSQDSKRVGEIAFQDYRILAAYGTLAITAVLVLLRRIPRGALSPVTRYLIATAAITYAAWLAVFGIYRYIVPLEMLAPLLAVAAISVWPGSVRLKGIAIAALLVVLALTGRGGDWTHAPWQDGPFVKVAAPAVEDPAHAMALITGTDPVAWVIPAFPPQIPFLRIYGYLNVPEQTDSGLNKRARSRIEAHQGAFYVLFPEKERPNAVSTLGAYGLAADFDSCLPVASNLGDYVRWCRVYRSDKTAADPT